MENYKPLRDSQIVIFGICVVIATVTASLILSKGFLRVTQFSRQVIAVTGSAEKKIVSDHIVWRGSFSRRDADMTAAYARLKEDLVAVRGYLAEKGIGDDEVRESPISTEILYKKSSKGNDTNEIEAYRLSMAVEVRTSKVDAAEALSRESTGLIQNGIEFISQSPEYFYTKLPELKLEMLSDAAANAKSRAERMAESTGSKVGAMRSAQMGVFQITPVNSTEVSDWGVNDTSSLEKRVTAVVRAEFSVTQ